MTRLIAPGRFTCPACGHRYSTLGAKRRHLRQEHGPKPVKSER